MIFTNLISLLSTALPSNTEDFGRRYIVINTSNDMHDPLWLHYSVSSLSHTWIFANDTQRKGVIITDPPCANRSTAYLFVGWVKCEGVVVPGRFEAPHVVTIRFRVAMFGRRGVAIINFSFSLCVLSRATQIFILSIFHNGDDHHGGISGALAWHLWVCRPSFSPTRRRDRCGIIFESTSRFQMGHSQWIERTLYRWIYWFKVQTCLIARSVGNKSKARQTDTLVDIIRLIVVGLKSGAGMGNRFMFCILMAN